MSCKRKEDSFLVSPMSSQSFLQGCNLSPADPQVRTIVYWFKFDCLRLDDNPGLNNAVLSAWEHKLMFQAIFIFDPWFNNKYDDRNNFSDTVMQFLFECLVDLDRQLMQIYGVRLRVYIGATDDVLKNLTVYWNIVKITFQSCIKYPEIMAYEESLIKQFRCNNVWAEGFSSHSLYDVKDFSHLSKDKIPTVFGKFELFVKSLNSGHIKCPVDFHKTLPLFDFWPYDTIWDGVDFSMLHQYGFPLQSNLFKKDWKGGETEARKKLSFFQIPRSEASADNYDMLVSKDDFSPYIRFGCISLKRLYYTLLISKANSPVRIERILESLMRREHAIVMGYSIQNLSIESNDLCIPISWDVNTSYVMAFRKGTTGFPWIDAIIRQIIQEGWACKKARKSIASFLTRGCLWMSWVEGVKFVQEFMLDFELSLSSVRWMHNAKCFVGDKDDGYNPLKEGKKLDPEGKFIKKYIPELENYPTEYVHNPWELPLIDQMIAGSIVGENYPNPIVDPNTIETVNKKKAQKLLKK